LGELPPYFVALAASKAGKTSEELDELKQEGGIFQDIFYLMC